MAATDIPTALRTADISRFALRAAQLEKYKPIVSYWLEYYVLQQILTKALHNDSPEVSAYAAQLMDKLESTKQQYSDEPAVIDDVAAQAYIEQFALQTLARAEKAQSDDTVTKQTADTLQAAATFFEALSIWGELNAESKTKVKFAKYHALRIVKALKNGQDPNATNPKPEPPPPTTTDPAELEVEDELRQLEQSSAAGPQTLQPTVEDVSDVEIGPDTATSAQGGLPSAPSITASRPVDESTSSTADRPSPVGEGYFPSTSPISAQSVTNVVPDLGVQPAFQSTPLSGPTSPTSARPTALQPGLQHPGDRAFAPPVQPTHADAQNFYSATPIKAEQPPVIAPPPSAETKSVVAQTAGFKTDDDAVMAAQKHAKWAISALNFEDVPTAVRELRKALESLGGL